MADRLKPENVEIVKRIRKFEEELFQEQSFKVYRNYCVPEQLVKNSKKVLSFGVGGDAHFEKLICIDNNQLDVRMYDPTPKTIQHLGDILYRGGWHIYKDLPDGNKLSREIVKNNLTFKPYAYAPVNGKMKFYYKAQEDTNSADDIGTSFSLVNTFEGPKSYIEVECKNIKTVMNELGWDHIDILKTDVEGLWYDVGKEIKDIDVKYWVAEMELNVGMTHNEAFDKVRELVELHKDKYNVYVNRKRLKAMMEVIFCRKDVDES